jgi:hypothetical protein
MKCYKKLIKVNNKQMSWETFGIDSSKESFNMELNLLIFWFCYFFIFYFFLIYFALAPPLDLRAGDTSAASVLLHFISETLGVNPYALLIQQVVSESHGQAKVKKQATYITHIHVLEMYNSYIHILMCNLYVDVLLLICCIFLFRVIVAMQLV